MNDWWKLALAGAAGAGLLAATGGTAAPGLAGMMGDTAAGAGAEAAGAAAAPSATAFVTPSVTGSMLGGATPATAGSASLDAIAASQPGYVANGQALDGLHSGGMLGNIGKAGSAYSSMQGAMGGQPPPRPAPLPQPIYAGQAPTISQPMTGMDPQQNPFAQMLLARRQRGMLG